MEKFIRNVKKSLLTGFYGVLILLLIKKYGPLHGYGLLKLFKEKIGVAMSPSESTIYTILKNYSKSGLLSSFWGLTSENVPRKYYEITVSGQKTLTELVNFIDSLIETFYDLKGDLT